jgi:diaminohydroxyphosphoribosylaminopyrimidine deaminase/5-amino-6-(5-phosphoribosylamino)uracil reductase
MNDTTQTAAAATEATAAPADQAALDRRYMELALALGRRNLGRTWPNPSVGAVLVKNGVIIGRGQTQPGGRPHAETQALKAAGRGQARGATLYTTLEPCSHTGKTPPCADALISAGVARVVSAIEDPNPEVAGQGHEKLRAKKIAVEVGLGEDEARRQHAGHIRRIRDGRPHIMLKLALSSDGMIGAAGRRRVEITGDEARERVFMMRAASDAIMVGKGTVLADDPALTCRLPGMEDRSPVRVVLNAKLNVPVASAVIATARETPTWMIGATATSAMAEEVLRGKGVDVIRADAGEQGFDLKQVVKMLAERGVTRLMVEGGAKVAASLVKADLVDELYLLRGPNPIGEGVPPLDGMPLSALTEAGVLRSVSKEMVGVDSLEHFVRA